MLYAKLPTYLNLALFLIKVAKVKRNHYSVELISVNSERKTIFHYWSHFPINLIRWELFAANRLSALCNALVEEKVFWSDYTLFPLFFFLLFSTLHAECYSTVLSNRKWIIICKRLFAFSKLPDVCGIRTSIFSLHFPPSHLFILILENFNPFDCELWVCLRCENFVTDGLLLAVYKCTAANSLKLYDSKVWIPFERFWWSSWRNIILFLELFILDCSEIWLNMYTRF